ncbi:hypothetical protein NEPAR04_1245 [Nematocida parisii]|nr:hypothetical protein NEPAR08_1309 [Nematocida parisii]KAI5128564.1 hypothetical protein NEPAR03_1371 [Nematocida parisii]KAI5141862.1 hypothetical protein NEPAR04_1245 [Nematocida parisii]
MINLIKSKKQFPSTWMQKKCIKTTKNILNILEEYCKLPKGSYIYKIIVIAFFGILYPIFFIVGVNLIIHIILSSFYSNSPNCYKNNIEIIRVICILIMCIGMLSDVLKIPFDKMPFNNTENHSEEETSTYRKKVISKLFKLFLIMFITIISYYTLSFIIRLCNGSNFSMEIIQIACIASFIIYIGEVLLIVIKFFKYLSFFTEVKNTSIFFVICEYTYILFLIAFWNLFLVFLKQESQKYAVSL